MSSFIRSTIFAAALFATGSLAGPVAVRDVEVLPAVAERGLPVIQLGTYDLATSHVDDVLLNIGASQIDGQVAETFHLEVECVDCRTWGSAVVTTAGVKKDDDIIGDIISFFEDPVDTIVSAFDMDIKISFEEVGGHFEFDILASDTVSYSYPLFMSETLGGSAVSEDVSLGLVVFIDLVFSLTAEVELEAGFEFAFPEGAYITVDPIGGDIVDHGFTGGIVSSLPMIVTSGSATLKASLRVRVQAGTTVECFGTGFDFELGVYADLIEYVATLDSTPTCEIEITESLDCNIGAFAHAVAEIDYKTFGVSPAVITTILDVPLPSLCLSYATGAASLTLDLPAPTGSAGYTGSLTIPVESMTSAYSDSASASASASFPTLYPSITASGSVPTSAPVSAADSTIIGGYGNSSSTISASASLVTSTVYSTTEIIITSCSSTVLHCPASLASEITVTSSVILYTTVCPYGASLPTTLASAASVSATTTAAAAIKTITAIVSPVSLTPCATPSTETIYTPTFSNPVYTMPTASSFPVAHPDYTASLTYIQPSASVVAIVSAASVVYPSSTAVASTIYVTSSVIVSTSYGAGASSTSSAAGVASTATIVPVPYPSSASGVPVASGNSSVLATGTGSGPKPTYTSVPFTGGASTSFGPSAAGLIGMLIAAVMIL